jgi:hypothetical protein
MQSIAADRLYSIPNQVALELNPVVAKPLAAKFSRPGLPFRRTVQQRGLRRERLRVVRRLRGRAGRVRPRGEYKIINPFNGFIQ